MAVCLVKEKKLIEHLFAGWAEACIWSCLQDCQGVAYADSLEMPKSAQIILGDFCYFAGMPNETLVSNKPQGHQSDFIIMTPQTRQWEELIERVWVDKATKRMRYATKKKPLTFDRDKLQGIMESLDAEYEIRMINEKLFESTRSIDWSKDWCCNFESYDEYQKHGLGVVIIKDGEVVAGASSYTYYNDGIEIEIDTHQSERQKGLASVCGAKLILECLARGLYPNWDAQNKISLKTAEKLGYEFDKEYVAYDVVGF